MEEATGARDPDAAPWPTTSARVRHQLAAMRLAMQRPARPPGDFLSTLPTDLVLRIRCLRADGNCGAPRQAHCTQMARFHVLHCCLMAFSFCCFT